MRAVRLSRKGMLAKLPKICMGTPFTGIRPVMYRRKPEGPCIRDADQPAIGMEVKGHGAWLFMSMFSLRVRI